MIQLSLQLKVLRKNRYKCKVSFQSVFIYVSDVKVIVQLEIMNVIEIDDQLSTLTFVGKLLLTWNEPRIKILKPEVLLTHDFSKQCLWSPSIFFRNQIYIKRQERLQNGLALKINNKTDQVMSYAPSLSIKSQAEAHVNYSGNKEFYNLKS